MSFPFYSKACSEVVYRKAQRITHPQTGEVYGGTDYDRVDKLAEIEAVPFREVGPEDGFRELTQEIVDDPENPGGKLRRPASVEAIPQPTAEEIAARKVELRAMRYKAECDPHLLAVMGYDLEIAVESDPEKKQALQDKQQAEATKYRTKKAAIRAEIQ